MSIETPRFILYVVLVQAGGQEHLPSLDERLGVVEPPRQGCGQVGEHGLISRPQFMSPGAKGASYTL